MSTSVQETPLTPFCGVPYQHPVGGTARPIRAYFLTVLCMSCSLTVSAMARRHHSRTRLGGVLVLLIERLAGHCRLVWDTPRYGVPSDMPTLLREKGIKLSMVWGKADILHTAQVDRWADGRRVNRIEVPHWEHGMCCTWFDKELKLHRRASWWCVEEQCR